MKLTDETGIIKENILVAADTYRMVIKGDLSRRFGPGQFVNLLIDGLTLRRPISISRYEPEEGLYVLYYKVLGEGTARMAAMKPGESIQVLGPLGTGFPIDPAHPEPVLVIGGGAGAGPLIQTARELRKWGYPVSVVLGFPTKDDVYAVEEFRALGIEPGVSTDDGSFGYHGNVLELIESRKETARLVYACGPKRMLRAVEERFERGYISLDVRMACGMGACMACVCRDRKEPGAYHRVCKEGPVFPIGRVVIE